MPTFAQKHDPQSPAASHPSATMRRSSNSRKILIEAFEPRQYLSVAAGGGLLTPTITQLKTPDIFVPLDTGTVQVTLSNTGIGTGSGTVEISIFASADQSLSMDDIPLAAPAFKHLAVHVLSEKMQKFSGKFTVPSNIAPGNYFILVEVSVISGFSGSTVSAGAVASAVSVPAEWAFGAVGSRKNVSLVHIAGDGAKETFTLSTGTGTLSDDGQGNLSVSVANTTSASKFRLKIFGGTGMATFANFSVDTAIGTISAPKMNVAGSLTIAGSAKTVSLDSLPLGSVTAIDGDLTSLTAAGDLGGQVTIAGNVGSISADNVLSGFVASIGGELTSLTTRGDFDGTLGAGSAIGTLTVEMAMTGAILLAGVTLGPDGFAGGFGDAGNSFAAGTIGTIHVTGSISTSFIGAGVSPVDGIFGNGNDQSAGASLIKSISAGGVDSGTRFEAPAFGIAKLPKKIDILADPRFIIL